MDVSKQEMIGRIIVDVDQGDDYITLTLRGTYLKSSDMKVKIEAFAQYDDATISTEVVPSDLL